MKSRRATAIAVMLGLSLALAPVPALAETSAEVREEVANTQAELETLSSRIAEGEARVQELQGQIETMAAESVELQTQIIEDRDQLAEIVATSYKDNADGRTLALLLSSKTVDELLSQVYYAQKVSDWQAECIERLNDDMQALEEQIAEIGTAKDEQQSALDELADQRSDLNDKVAALNAKAEQLEAEERAAAQAAAEEAARKAAEEQAAREEQERQREDALRKAQQAGDIDEYQDPSTGGTSSGGTSDNQGSTPTGGGWVSCVASAYTIADNDPPGSTATASGIPLDESVPTVAMPMSMNPSQFYGSTIEISYNGMSVIATVTDCGAMGGGSRGLDLTPAVFRAFGASSADEWGLRTVSYRFL